MTESFAWAVRGRCRPGAGFLFRTGAPHAGGVAVPAHRAGDRCGWPAAGVRQPVRGRGRLAGAGRVAGRGRGAGPGPVVRRPGTVADGQGRLPAAGAQGAGQRPRPKAVAAASDLGLWLDVAHAVVVLPVALVTSVVTVAVVVGRPRRRHVRPAGRPARPATRLRAAAAETLYAGSPHPLAVSLGLTSPTAHVAFAITIALLLLVTLPLVTRACTAAQAGLGRVLLSDASVLLRRISGLERSGTPPARRPSRR